MENDSIYNHKALNYAYNGQLNFEHEVKTIQLTPTGTIGNGGVGSGDTVRINLTSDDFLDPYNTFLEFTIDLSNSTALNDDVNITNKILQVDNSASSFISSMIVNLQDKEIERIDHYDVLAAWLKDVQYDTDKRAQKDYEGNGGINSPSLPSNYMTTYSVPIANDGVKKPLMGLLPQIDNCTYTDTNSRIVQSPGSTQYTTRNFSAAYTQTAWTPCGPNALWSQGSDINEIDNNFSDNTRVTGNYRSIPGIHGFQQPYNPTFATTGFEPWFSKTVPTRYLKSGFIKSDLPLTMTFQVPLISSFFGCLLPPEQWKLIPLKYFKGLQFDFRFAQHALFSSWMSKDQSVRAYQVKKFVMNCNLVKILDPEKLRQVENEYQQNGITISSQAFFYGPNYTISNGSVPSSLLINLGFQSLKNLFFMFTPNDYSIDTSCRKHYRLSMAITAMQLLIGTDYYPQQPITGNGGTNFGPINNNDFVKCFWKCFNRQCGQFGGAINQHNFAINCRELDPTTTDVNFTGNTQLGFFCENRVIGKCVYGIPLDSLNYESKMWSGRDTTKNVPFQLNLTYDNSRTFPRNCTMHTWCHHDYLLKVDGNGVMTLGRK